DEDPLATTAACTTSDLTNQIGTDLTVIGGHSNSRVRSPFANLSVQAQQATRFGGHQLLVGGDYSRTRKTFGCHDFVTSTIFSGTFAADQEYRSIERSGGVYARDDVEVTSWLHATAGVRYVDGLYQDPLKSTPDFTFTRWNPFAGVSVRVAPTTIVQAAAFRNTNADFISSRIAPPTVAGFVLERNELPTAQRDE